MELAKYFWVDRRRRRVHRHSWVQCASSGQALNIKSNVEGVLYVIDVPPLAVRWHASLLQVLLEHRPVLCADLLCLSNAGGSAG